MGKYVRFLLLLGALCLWGCGQRTDAREAQGGNAREAQGGNAQGTPSGADTPAFSPDAGASGTEASEMDTDALGTGATGAGRPSDALFGCTKRFEIIDVKEKSMLVCGVDDMKGLYNVGHGSRLEDSEGKPAAVSDLRTGMIVELAWEGYVEEIYPATFSYEKLRMTEETGSKELDFYKTLVKDLAETDPGLNDGIVQSFFDLTGVNTLSGAEKEGLAYIGGSYFGTLGSVNTEESLAEEGILDPVKGIENGILITIEETSAEGGHLTCNARKYRSGTGAYYFNDVKAVWEEGKWTYTIGNHMIS